MDLSAFKERIATVKPVKGGSEWTDLVGELTDFLNSTRGNFGPKNGWSYPQIARYVSYMKKAESLGELRFFIDNVKDKGSWYFWWTVKPKKK